MSFGLDTFFFCHTNTPERSALPSAIKISEMSQGLTVFCFVPLPDAAVSVPVSPKTTPCSWPAIVDSSASGDAKLGVAVGFSEGVGVHVGLGVGVGEDDGVGVFVGEIVGVAVGKDAERIIF